VHRKLPYARYPLAYALDEHLLMDEALNGVSVVAASGHLGSSCNLSMPADKSAARLSVSYPASSPYVTGVGGELLGLNPNDTLKSQQTWNDLPSGVGEAGGGGDSADFARPWYQKSLSIKDVRRLVPDVALEADVVLPVSVYCNSGCRSMGWQAGGGTSATTPLLAGGLALADQVAESRKQASLGLARTHSFTISGQGVRRHWSPLARGTTTSMTLVVARPAQRTAWPPDGDR
jgi:subtilase family serine protease